MKKNKGITLIALVITMIVLLILAGVAIAMLSGENGILKKAAQAKTETEQAQKEEETTLTDMEMTTNFLTNNLKYKIKNGYMTGFTVGDKVDDINSKLEPLGYKINLKYDYENDKDIVIEEDENPFIATGMSVQKNGQTVTRTVIFGDLNCDGIIDNSDALLITNVLSEKIDINKGYQKIVADVNQDNSINVLDTNLIIDDFMAGSGNQYIYANNPENIKIEIESKLAEEYRKKMNEKVKVSEYIIEYIDSNNTKRAVLKGANSQTKVGAILDIFMDSNVSIRKGRKVYDQDEYVETESLITYKHSDGRNIELYYIIY